MKLCKGGRLCFCDWKSLNGVDDLDLFLSINKASGIIFPSFHYKTM